MKRIAVITTSRADYGIYLPLLNALPAHDLIATGETDYIDRYHVCFYVDAVDIAFVLGDTMPMLEAAMWAASKNITVCHIHGGDTTGSIDNKIRYAISALADWHFPSLPEHAERLKSMGCPEDRIRVVGALGIYAMKDAEYIPDLELRQQLGLSDKPIILIIQHPVSTEWRQAGDQIRETLEAVKCFPDCEPVVIYPNSERGSEAMIQVIRQYPLKSFENLPYLTFISLLTHSTMIVGNSSCGLVEAPLFGVPCVNIGTRQGDRIRGRNCYQADYNKHDIKFQIIDAFPKTPVSHKSPYSLQVDGVKVILDTLSEM